MLINVKKIMKVKNIGKENRDIINTDVEIKEKDQKIISACNRIGKKII